MVKTNNNFNNLSKEKLLEALGKTGGIDINKVSSAINSGNVDNLLNSLGENDANKLKSLLNNKEALNRIISSDKFNDMLKQFMK